MLGYYSLQGQHNGNTSRTYQKLPPYGKEYLCFKIDGKTARAAQCFKSRALTKFIGSIIEIETFKQKCVIIIPSWAKVST